MTQAIPDGDYYRQRAYAGRPDRIYKWRGDGTFSHRRDAQFHWSDKSHVRDEHLRHDLGSSPDYERSTMLLSHDYRYFGAGSPVPLNKAVWSFVHDIGRGHRVHNISADLVRELRGLRTAVWDHENLEPAQPSQVSSRARSHRGGHCIVFPMRRECAG